MSKNNFKAILAEKKSLGSLYTPNYYEIMGIEDFSTYDEKLKIRRIELARTEIKDDSDQRDMKELINNANSILKDANLKAKYDESLKIINTRSNPSEGVQQKVGFPSLTIENEDSFFFNEAKLNSVFTQSIVVKNGSGGILNGTITLSNRQKWLDINPKTIKQSDLPLRVNITVNTKSDIFSLGDLKSEVIFFSYRTDNGLKEERRRVEVRTEGLYKKNQRLSLYSIWIFVGLYAILVGIQSFNNFGTFPVTINLAFFFRILTWISIPILYLFLRDYNLLGGEKLRNVFRRETFREKLELVTIGLLFFYGFELFAMFAIGVGVLWLNKQVFKTGKIKNGTFFTPFVGFAFYGLLITQFPYYLKKYTNKFDNNSTITATPPTIETSVQLLKDCNIRTYPYSKSAVVMVGKIGETYILTSDTLINNDWARVKFEKNGIAATGYIQIKQGRNQIISK